jgi:tRNA 2-selenouridine synthase
MVGSGAVIGREKINGWNTLAESGHTAALVEALLVEHYDPAYLRSIERNFVGYRDAQILELSGIDDTDFSIVANTLISEE